MNDTLKNLHAMAVICREFAAHIADYAGINDSDTLERQYDFIYDMLQNAYCEGRINFPTWNIWHDKNLAAYAKCRAKIKWGGVSNGN